MARPIFVSKKNRGTTKAAQEEASVAAAAAAATAAAIDGKEKASSSSANAVRERRAAVARAMIEDAVRAELADEAAAEALLIDTDDGEPEVELAAWRVRELRRVKRDRDAREALEREARELERVREMTPVERDAYFREHGRTVTNQREDNGARQKFMQKYYHRGAFFMDEESDLYKRNTIEATGDDHYDRAAMPKVMQVKRFGRAGNSKYTHLRDQDTTDKSSPWARRDRGLKRAHDHDDDRYR
eukprot:UC1_evm2s1719